MFIVNFYDLIIINDVAQSERSIGFKDNNYDLRISIHLLTLNFNF